MKKIFFLLLLAACNNAAVNNSENKADTTVASVSTDSSSVAGVKADDYAGGPSFVEIRDDYVKGYYARLNIDTSFFVGDDTIRFQYQYHCKMDSAVIVPKKYVNIYGLENFVTHNFTSSVLITQQDKTILKREINKNDFDKVLEDPLKEYAVMLYPYLHYYADSITINYSISIPLTDLGIGVAAIIKPDGAISFGRN
jgi:hypothetical protein